MKIQIVENEEFIPYADFDNCKVWILNRLSQNELDSRIINFAEVSESFAPSSEKLPKLLYQIFESYDEGIEDYELITDDKEKFAAKIYACEVERIKEISVN